MNREIINKKLREWGENVLTASGAESYYIEELLEFIRLNPNLDSHEKVFNESIKDAIGGVWKIVKHGEPPFRFHPFNHDLQEFEKIEYASLEEIPEDLRVLTIHSNNLVRSLQVLSYIVEKKRNELETKEAAARVAEIEIYQKALSDDEKEPTPGQIEKLRYLHLSGLLPHLIKQHKRIRNTNPPTANWDSIAHVVSRMIGEPVQSIRKTIREHYTNHNQRLEDFNSKGGKSKEEVLGFLKSKEVRE